uniref:Uncharacterized protein n=1 Tax=Cucumis melo TaxID=3656 RepID=A0A9I9E7A7_CUCME
MAMWVGIGTVEDNLNLKKKKKKTKIYKMDFADRQRSKRHRLGNLITPRRKKKMPETERKKWDPFNDEMKPSWIECQTQSHQNLKRK